VQPVKSKEIGMPELNEIESTYENNFKRLKDDLLKLQNEKGHKQKIILSFSRPVEVSKDSRRMTVESLVINGVFTGEGSGQFCYLTPRQSRRGYLFTYPMVLHYLNAKLTKDNSENLLFKHLEDFSKKFDRRFISEDLIKQLYEEGKTSEGRPWLRTDFKRLGDKGESVMERFLGQFTDINTKTVYYFPTTYSPDGYLSSRRDSWNGKGRDISISHSVGSNKVFFSSEYPGCGNGQYYLVANEKEVLHLEND
jgi:hypothetical protein